MATELAVEDEEEVPPRPSALIESLRSFGYSPATAIADLLDNSITAGAGQIEVQFNWAGPDSTVTVLDDGGGMSEDELRNAMRAGSSNPSGETHTQRPRAIRSRVEDGKLLASQVADGRHQTTEVGPSGRPPLGP